VWSGRQHNRRWRRARRRDVVGNRKGGRRSAPLRLLIDRPGDQNALEHADPPLENKRHRDDGEKQQHLHERAEQRPGLEDRAGTPLTRTAPGTPTRTTRVDAATAPTVAASSSHPATWAGDIAVRTATVSCTNGSCPATSSA
jgi:hypothetical protein